MDEPEEDELRRARGFLSVPPSSANGGGVGSGSRPSFPRSIWRAREADGRSGGLSWVHRWATWATLIISAVMSAAPPSPAAAMWGRRVGSISSSVLPISKLFHACPPLITSLSYPNLEENPGDLYVWWAPEAYRNQEVV